MRIRNKREKNDVPQDEYDRSRRTRVRDYLDNAQDIMQDLADWMAGSRGRVALIGVLTIVVALMWWVVLVLVSGGHDNQGPSYRPVEQVTSTADPSASS